MPTETQTEDTTAADEKAAKAAEAKAEAKAAKKAAAEEAKAAKAKEQAEAKAAALKAKIETAATEGGVKLDDITGTGAEGAITLADVKKAVQARKAEERASRPKKAALTLSQRRAVLKLADGPITPANAFNATPLEYLKSVGLAQSETVSVDEPYTEKEDQEQPIPEAERKEGGPTTKTVKVAVGKTRSVNRERYSLTDEGRKRAGELNPKWKTWKPEGSESTTAATPTSSD